MYCFILENFVERDDFISAIGYDGGSAVVDKVRRAKNKAKTIEQLLEEGSFRAATAFAINTGKDEDLQKVADKYNELSNSNYTKEQIPRLFGVSKVEVKKRILL